MKRFRAIIVVAAVVVVVVGLCLGGFALLNRLYTPAPITNLPLVATFAYVTPTSIVPAGGTIVPAAPTATPSPQPFFNFPWFSAATATLSPTPSKTPLPYKPPTATLTPVSIIVPAATSTSTSAPPPTAAVPNCRNILYPVKAGYEWNYQVTARSRSGEVHMKVLSVDGSRGLVAVQNQSRGLNGQTYVVCDRDVIINFPSLNAELLLGNALDGTMRADYVSGVLAPNEAAFAGNNWALAWSGRYLISGSGMVKFRGSDFNLVLNPSNITMTCQTLASGEAAFESVTVTAGTFRALKVVCVGQGQGLGTINGSPITGWVTAQSTQWFAPYVGLVKMKSDYANLDVFGFTIPLDTNGLNGSVELRNFVQTP